MLPQSQGIDYGAGPGELMHRYLKIPGRKERRAKKQKTNLIVL
jgi:hypothetical protein